jgi:transcriptional regulator with XRE-family HTH domain
MYTARILRFRDFGAVIKAVRESRGQRQEDLADALVISRNYLQELENGKPNLYVTRLFRALNKLGIEITVTYTLGRDKDQVDARPDDYSGATSPHAQPSSIVPKASPL